MALAAASQQYVLPFNCAVLRHRISEGELSWQKSMLYPEDLKTSVIGK